MLQGETAFKSLQADSVRLFLCKEMFVINFELNDQFTWCTGVIGKECGIISSA